MRSLTMPIATLLLVVFVGCSASPKTSPETNGSEDQASRHKLSEECSGHDKIDESPGKFHLDVVAKSREFVELLQGPSSYYIGHCESRFYLARYAREGDEVVVWVHSISQRYIDEDVLRSSVLQIRETREARSPFQYPVIREYVEWRREHVVRTEAWETPRGEEGSTLGVFR